MKYTYLKTVLVTTAALGYETNLPQVSAGHSQLNDVLQLIIGITAAISVLFVVIGGLRFVLSSGDPQGANKARDTIIYAIIGLLVAVAAEAVVTFTVNRL